MDDDKIKEYIANGGKFFNIKKIDSYRDGGTIVIETTTSTYYAHLGYCKTLHYEYPPHDRNLIRDNLLKEFLIERLNVFIEKQRESQIRNEKIVNLIIQNNHD